MSLSVRRTLIEAAQTEMITSNFGSRMHGVDFAEATRPSIDDTTKASPFGKMASARRALPCLLRLAHRPNVVDVDGARARRNDQLESNR
uniref:Uncharacterized protein n=1 Tax=Pristionchus pacificus TaxID=54126 RepID=A0A2A6BRN5_PRIPA|eukprot:PDM68528.1 hypothetical protein PRIPAC_44030 [Pristionchus pacificus]